MWFNIIKSREYQQLHYRRFTTMFHPDMEDAGLKDYADELLRFAEETLKRDDTFLMTPTTILINNIALSRIPFVLSRDSRTNHTIYVNMNTGVVQHYISNTPLREISAQELRQIIDGLLGEE